MYLCIAVGASSSGERFTETPLRVELSRASSAKRSESGLCLLRWPAHEVAADALRAFRRRHRHAPPLADGRCESGAIICQYRQDSISLYDLETSIRAQAFAFRSVSQPEP